MSQDDKNIVTTIENVKFFMRELGSMLSTVDGALKEKGWDFYTGSTLGGFSGAISNPFMWVPSYIFRFYYKKDHPNYVGFCSVILCSPGDNIEMEECLVSAGMLKYPEGFDVTDNNNWQYDYAYSHLKMSDRKNDGSLSFSDKERLWQNKDEDFKIVTFAYPLSEISDQLALNEKVINKFLSLRDQLG